VVAVLVGRQSTLPGWLDRLGPQFRQIALRSLRSPWKQKRKQLAELFSGDCLIVRLRQIGLNPGTGRYETQANLPQPYSVLKP
jgi:hypothetical protein